MAIYLLVARAPRVKSAAAVPLASRAANSFKLSLNASVGSTGQPNFSASRGAVVGWAETERMEIKLEAKVLRRTMIAIRDED